jgi:hypothetical protein
MGMSSKPPRRPMEQKPQVYSGMRSSWTGTETAAASSVMQNDSEIVDEFIVTTEMQPEGLLHPDTMIPIVTDDGNHE